MDVPPGRPVGGAAPAGVHPRRGVGRGRELCRARSHVGRSGLFAILLRQNLKRETVVLVVD
jgi:hypothetical protein